MRAETFVRIAHHHVKPLVIRGGLARTFGSLASFLAVLFLLLGLYLLGDGFQHPRWMPRPQKSSLRRSALRWRLFCFTSSLNPGMFRRAE
jgi:hypothetical protein